MPVLRPRPLPRVLLFSLVPIASSFLVRPFLDPFPAIPALYASIGFSIFAFLTTIYLVPALGPTFIKAKLGGVDLLKVYDNEITKEEKLMWVYIKSKYGSFNYLMIQTWKPWACSRFHLHPLPDSLYSLCLLKANHWIYRQKTTRRHYRCGISTLSGLPHLQLPNAPDLPPAQLAVYLSSLLSLLVATLLGFLDDIFDIRWRHKLPIPIIASIPLLMVYYAEQGNTNVVVPLPLRFLFGTLINLGRFILSAVLNAMSNCVLWLHFLGPLYYVYMALLSTFSTNSINILAGINGSEVSQALIIALSVIINDLLYLPWPIDLKIPLHLLGNHAELEFGGVWNAGMAHGSRELVERHLFSLYFMLPLVAVCSGFLYHNWWVVSSIAVMGPYILKSGISGIQQEFFLGTRYVMRREWLSQ